ncbi:MULTISPECIES: VOC family protein [Mycobacterium]|uniref:Lactoylglutathione lyase n=1 Tax=Mycobacterium kiyosense TaxID=2871094 RepID=A0A9P3Q2K7_9MYCO|nr:MULTISPECIES: VOC family protein [Mycobacterium]BDB42583.1 lactoylglutathione lyase [Mycobacterium kiyosense]BDE14158.1 lactoylglutathione lyase [Mycobacterium sp. 20KCMC460]GLB82991.1 lactoylglutathione lyase [Mycobacterium kiyosense]GLB89168.1 lactoylglutathione lyase [Mycobacterium kiyosense]GLB93819.1 lactoylglutathione lyase [Mycobacterium kiyosense]
MNLLVQSPVQIAWVTSDLAATEKALTGLLGARKWVRIPDVHFAPDACSYRGEPADFVAHISLSYLGDMQLELIEPVRGENIYSEFLRDHGAGLHHICMEAQSREQFDAALVDAAEQGAEVVQQGVMAGGIRFAYVAAPNAGVPYVEIAYLSPEIKAFYDYIKQEQQVSRGNDDAHRSDEQEARR